MMFKHFRNWITNKLRIAVLFIVSAFAHTAFADTFLRVDGDNGLTVAQGATGLDWEHAFKFLQDAIDEVDNVTLPVQIWVKGDDDADGIVYRPDQGATVTFNDKSETITLKDEVSILGGFAGGETTKNARNPLLYLTVITGEINDAGLSDNTYHIITSIRNQPSASIDGFTIRDGNANNGALAITHRVGGGALIIGLTAPDPTSLTVEDSTPGIVRCKFINNHARFGGAIYVHVDQLSFPLIGNCEFRDNLALNGGAVYVEASTGPVGGPQLVNCLAVNNTADFESGVSGSGSGSVAFVQTNGVLFAINSTFTLNIAEAASGSTLHHAGSCPTGPPRLFSITCDSSIVWNNTIGATGAEFVGSNGVQYSCVEDLGGVCTDFDLAVIDDDPDFMNAASNFRLSSGSPCIDEGWSETIEGFGDTYDLDQNGSLTGAMPDLDNRTRIVSAYDTARIVAWWTWGLTSSPARDARRTSRQRRLVMDWSTLMTCWQSLAAGGRVPARRLPVARTSHPHPAAMVKSTSTTFWP